MTDSQQTRVCIRCGEDRPLTSFPRDGRLAQGRGSRCNSCAYRARKAAVANRPPRPKPDPLPRRPWPVAVLADLIDTPTLAGAACRGWAAIFDPAEDIEEDDQQRADRIALAVSVCRNECPALAACRQWVTALPAKQRPSGVVAGQLTEHQGGQRDR